MESSDMLTLNQKESIVGFIRTMGEVTVWGQAENLGGKLDSEEVDEFLSKCADALDEHVLALN